MKICIVSDSYYPHHGGVTEHLHHLAIELRRLGNTVKILTSRYPETPHDDDPDVHRVGRSILVPINQSYATLTVGLSVAHDVRDYLREHRFDIVHTHGPLAPTLPLLALWYSRSTNIATFHAARDTTPAYAMFSRPLQPLFRKIDGPIAVSEVARRSIARYFPGDYTIIPNGVDVERFHPQAPPLEDYTDGRPNILFVGRFDPRKGLPYLLEAMPQILRSEPEARLIVVGDGRSRRKLEELVEDSTRPAIEFVGRVAPEMMPRYFASADIYCSPATGRESFGITLLEGMASGAVVVAFDNDGYKGVIEHERDGVLVPNRDRTALAGTVIDLLQQPERRQRIRARALETATRFSWARVAAQVEAYYREKLRR